MSLQILTLKLEGITAGDYLTWCQDPDPPALDYALRSISVDGDPLGDTITATLDWNQSPPTPAAAATAAGLPLTASVQIHALAPLDLPGTRQTLRGARVAAASTGGHAEAHAPERGRIAARSSPPAPFAVVRRSAGIAPERGQA